MIYILIIGYAAQLREYIVMILALVAFLMLMTANFAFFIYYKKDIVKDPSFLKWTKLYPRT